MSYDIMGIKDSDSIHDLAQIGFIMAFSAIQKTVEEQYGMDKVPEKESGKSPSQIKHLRS